MKRANLSGRDEDWPRNERGARRGGALETGELYIGKKYLCGYIVKWKKIRTMYDPPCIKTRLYVFVNA